MKHFASLCCFAIFACVTSVDAFAEGNYNADESSLTNVRIDNNDRYGYIIGTINNTEYLNDDRNYTVEPHGIEPVGLQGAYDHYYFFVDITYNDHTDTFFCVIDIKNYLLYEPTYRIINIPSYSSFNGIFTQQNDKYELNNNHTNTSGALDYIRDPDILESLNTDTSWRPGMEIHTTNNGFYTESGFLPIDEYYNTPWVDNTWQHLETNLRYMKKIGQFFYPIHEAPAIDALFDNVSRVYVFGEFFDDGTDGVHNVHQFQGDRLEGGYAHDDGKYRDGGVIFEYPDGSRKLLMVKFGEHTKNNNRVYGQIDFSNEEPFTTIVNNEIVTYDSIAADYITDQFIYDPNINPSTVTYGPFTASQIEVIAVPDGDVASFHPRPHFEANCTDVDIELIFAGYNGFYTPIKSELSGCHAEYLRSSNDYLESRLLHSYLIAEPSYYVKVKYNSGDQPVNVYVRYHSVTQE